MSQLALARPLILKEKKRKSIFKRKEKKRKRKGNNDLADLPSHDTYIHPPFKIVTSQSNRLGMKNVVELRVSDVSWSPKVFAMELCCEFWSGDFRGGLPGIVFTAISLPLDEVLESSLVPTTVKYLFYFLLQFSVDDYGRWVVLCFLACNQVVWSWSELYYIEHWMELLHLVWQP